MRYEDHLDNQRELYALNINFPVGCDVILKSADNKPYKKGKRTGYTYVSKSNRLQALITLEDGTDVIQLGAIMKVADPRLLKALDKLTPVEQWNVMANNYFIDDGEL